SESARAFTRFANVVYALCRHFCIGRSAFFCVSNIALTICAGKLRRRRFGIVCESCAATFCRCPRGSSKFRRRLYGVFDEYRRAGAAQFAARRTPFGGALQWRRLLPAT
ncbi:MAG: hypothetical protein DBX55_03345, partial [Verrucomicrobia bacterium]